MTFPTVTRTASTTTGTSGTINLPSNPKPGDVILILANGETGNAGSNGFSWPDATWVELFDTVVVAGNQSSWVAVYHFCTGAEGGSITVTTTAAVEISAHAFLIKGSGYAPEHAETNGKDCPNLAPSWGSADTLWIVGCATGFANASVTAAPTNYTGGNFTSTQSSAGAACALASSWRTNTASSEDPGAFTSSYGANRTCTVGLRPAPPGPVLRPRGWRQRRSGLLVQGRF